MGDEKMNDKERLQTIKDQFKWGEENLESGIYNLESDDINWLIEQAEKVQEIQQENKYYREQLDISRNMAADIIVGLLKELMEYKNKSNNK